jgi:hypothetical protein
MNCPTKPGRAACLDELTHHHRYGMLEILDPLLVLEKMLVVKKVIVCKPSNDVRREF